MLWLSWQAAWKRRLVENRNCLGALNYVALENAGRFGCNLRCRIETMTEQSIALIRARNRAFRWPKGQSGNPGGQSRFYHEARKLARRAAPEMMKG
jgi:hypothetical protein